jgi:hypothetical protein
VGGAYGGPFAAPKSEPFKKLGFAVVAPVSRVEQVV